MPSDVGARENFVLGPLTAIRDSAKVIDKTSRGYAEGLPDASICCARTRRSCRSASIEANFAFYGQQLRGQPQQRERWKRGVAITSDALGELVGQVYVKEYFPPESKAKMEVLVDNLRAALKDVWRRLSWMSAETRKRARGKARDVRCQDRLSGQMEGLLGARSEARRPHRQRAPRVALGLEPPDRAPGSAGRSRRVVHERHMTINAYYNPLNNEIVFPAAILQPPFFDPAADDAVNYGGIGAVIGHEIGHGFDDQGRKFAPDGSLHDWWTKVDADAFGAKTKVLVDQYSAFDALPGLKVNGAHLARREHRRSRRPEHGLRGLSQLVAGQAGAGARRPDGRSALLPVLGAGVAHQDRDEALRAQVLSDPQSAVFPRQRRRA